MAKPKNFPKQDDTQVNSVIDKRRADTFGATKQNLGGLGINPAGPAAGILSGLLAARAGQQAVSADQSAFGNALGAFAAGAGAPSPNAIKTAQDKELLNAQMISFGLTPISQVSPQLADVAEAHGMSRDTPAAFVLQAQQLFSQANKQTASDISLAQSGPMTADNFAIQARAHGMRPKDIKLATENMSEQELRFFYNDFIRKNQQRAGGLTRQEKLRDDLINKLRLVTSELKSGNANKARRQELLVEERDINLELATQGFFGGFKITPDTSALTSTIPSQVAGPGLPVGGAGDSGRIQVPVGPGVGNPGAGLVGAAGTLPTTPPTQPAPGLDRLRIKMKASGQTGTIQADDFNPAIMDKI